MKVIAHRKNTLQELLLTPVSYGVEMDVRSYGSSLVLEHDPFKKGEPIEIWLDAYRHGTLILNVKEEGLEETLLAMLHARGIEDFFFLDQSFPFLMKWANRGEKRCAVRVSEYEHLDTALALQGKVSWVWVDCFTRFPLSQEDAKKLKKAGFKLCLVSAELHGRDFDTGFQQMTQALQQQQIYPEAVCTKKPDRWLSWANTCLF